MTLFFNFFCGTSQQIALPFRLSSLATGIPTSWNARRSFEACGYACVSCQFTNLDCAKKSTQAEASSESSSTEYDCFCSAPSHIGSLLPECPWRAPVWPTLDRAEKLGIRVVQSKCSKWQVTGNVANCRNDLPHEYLSRIAFVEADQASLAFGWCQIHGPSSNEPSRDPSASRVRWSLCSRGPT